MRQNNIGIWFQGIRTAGLKLLHAGGKLFLGTVENQLPLTAARRRRKFIVNGMIVVSGNHNHKIVIPGFAFIIAAVEHISAGFGMIVIPIGAFHFPAVRPQPGNVFRPVGFNHLAVKKL